MVDEQKESACVAIYDRLADGYGYDINATFSGQVKLELLRRYVRPEFRVLDVGCANGIHMRAVAPWCAHITGIDINNRMLSLAVKKFQEEGLTNVDLKNESATALPFANGSFDMAYSFSTLLLVHDVAAAIAEMSRVLRDGGIALFDIAGRHNLSRVYWGHYYRSRGHFGINTFTREQSQRLLRDRGFEILEEHAFGVLDQWKCIPGVNRINVLDRLVHGWFKQDLDYAVSNKKMFSSFATRWYIAARKRCR